MPSHSAAALSGSAQSELARRRKPCIVSVSICRSGTGQDIDRRSRAADCLVREDPAAGLATAAVGPLRRVKPAVG